MTAVARALAVAKERVTFEATTAARSADALAEARTDLARLRVLALRDLETIEEVISAAVLEGNPELVADALEQLASVR